MPYCSNCGTQLPDNAKFCNECGSPQTNNSSRKTVYDGEIHKCPCCNEVLDSFTANCPSCGYELRGASATNSVNDFVANLNNAKTDAQKLFIIRNHPIPNAKEDIWEFMILASSNLLTETLPDVLSAWNTKFEQCYQKARLLLSKNDLSQIQELYDNTKKKVRAKKFTTGTVVMCKSVPKIVHITWSIISKTIDILFVLFEILLKNLPAILSVVSFLKAIKMDNHSNGADGIGYVLLGSLLLITSAALSFRKSITYFELALVIGIELFTFYLANFTDNGVGMQFFGGIALLLTFISFIVRVSRSSQSNNQ